MYTNTHYVQCDFRFTCKRSAKAMLCVWKTCMHGIVCCLHLSYTVCFSERTAGRTSTFYWSVYDIAVFPFDLILYCWDITDRITIIHYSFLYVFVVLSIVIFSLKYHIFLFEKFSSACQLWRNLWVYFLYFRNVFAKVICMK